MKLCGCCGGQIDYSDFIGRFACSVCGTPCLGRVKIEMGDGKFASYQQQPPRPDGGPDVRESQQEYFGLNKK
jgi:hypothetical protein